MSVLVARRGDVAQRPAVFDPLSYGWDGAWRASLQSGSPADGDPIATLSGQVGGRDLTAAGSARPTWKAAAVGGLPAWDFDGLANLAMGAAASTFVAAAAFEAIVVAQIDTLETNIGEAVVYANEMLFGDGEYWGLFLRSAPSMAGAAYDGDWRMAEATIATGVPMVLAFRHEAGQLIVSRDGGTEGTRASGNTGDLSSALRLGGGIYGGGTRFIDGKVADAFVRKTVLSSGDRATLIAGLMDTYGIA